MDKEERIKRVLSGLSHTGYTTELERCEARFLIEELTQQCKKQKEVIDKAIEKINDYKVYCKENKGLTEYTDIEIEAIEPMLIKIEDILKEVSE